MKRLTLMVATLALVATTLAFVDTPNPTDEIQGAWTVVEVTNPEGETNPITSPNLTLFTERHYAAFRIGGEGPREMFPDEPTDAQRLEAFTRFISSAGTYTVSGDELSTTVMMHRNPNVMAEGESGTSTIEIDGDAMVRTFTNPENGAQFIVKYERQ